jgi:uncharacterized membrane protein
VAERPERRRALDWRAVSLILSVLGIGVAGYLVFVHYDRNALVCNVGNCERVQTSPYSEIAGIPIALFGLGMYLTLVGLSVARRLRPGMAMTLSTASFVIVLAGTVYAAYLTYLEIAVIKAICQWCVASAILTIGILAAEGYGVYQMLGVPPER